jgi:trehalose 6-phosphate synthase
MRLSLRFVLPLAAVLALLAYLVIPLVDALTIRWFVRDLDIRSKLIANTMEASLVDLVASNKLDKLRSYFGRIIQDERLYAIGFCDSDDRLAVRTETWPKGLACGDVVSGPSYAEQVREVSRRKVHIAGLPITTERGHLGRLVLVHDMRFVFERSADTKWYIFYFILLLGVTVAGVTVAIAHLSLKGWVASVRTMMRSQHAGDDKQMTAAPELQPVAQDLRELVSDLQADRRMRDEMHTSWTPASLRGILHDQLAGDEVLIVSNRQPYIHARRDGHIELQVPASGLVSALEPVMRACSGVWIAHGNGSADREVVDARDHVRVPPDNPAYEIRRLWLSPEEEAGYYYGFANEGLWPLCHLAHIRPTFRTSDWLQYVAVNRRFAEAVQQEAKTPDPVVLVQDYHFALLPKMVRERLPGATIITFWHIPWPNAEQFSICPWLEDILEGMLGSSIVGFHTRMHCTNFLQGVDRFLEARIAWEESTVSYGGKLTAVKPYPISIEWPSQWNRGQLSIPDCRAAVRRTCGMDAERRVGIGVDRLDYTKGIIERCLAVERLLELESRWIGKFTFVQIGAPTRSAIPQYQTFADQVRALVDRINARFGAEGYQPICLKMEHHEPPEVYRYFRGADVAVVSSLHDGMNLVAKEFVAARDDEQGVLILSRFTGAARELHEALAINPYDIDECAAALHVALTMSPQEQQARMRSMRTVIQDWNIYRWAGRMLMDAAQLRQRERVLKKVRRSAQAGP